MADHPVFYLIRLIQDSGDPATTEGQQSIFVSYEDDRDSAIDEAMYEFRDQAKRAELPIPSPFPWDQCFLEVNGPFVFGTDKTEIPA